MVSRPVIGAHYGLRDWLVQRVTAIYMALFTLGFAISLFGLGGFNYHNWAAYWAAPAAQFFGFLFVLSVIYHAWVGVRDIWMDYGKPDGLRLVLHLVTLFLLIGYTGWAIRILWRL
jgi:succinate dehydrogenase / fumarate reductase membrane anchor subunit